MPPSRSWTRRQLVERFNELRTKSLSETRSWRTSCWREFRRAAWRSPSALPVSFTRSRRSTLRPASSTWQCIAMTWERALNCRSCENRNFHCRWKNAPSSLWMTFFTPAAPCAPPWMPLVRSGAPHEFSLRYSSTAATASCLFVPITLARICRLQAAKRCAYGSNKPIANPTRYAWKSNEHIYMTTRWTRKDLVGLRELSVEEINFILETADAFKQVGTREIKKVPSLRGKTLVNFFVEPSTRTRTSFELAALRLSADVINISATSSSLTKGETLKDTARNLEALHADILVLRHSSAGAPQFLANRLKASVINAGDGAHEHPTQALLDLYTIRERRGKIAGLRVAIIGDILFSRVARSNIFGLLKLGGRVTLVGPSTLVPCEFEKLGVEVSHKIENVLPSADVVNLLRIQHERQRREYFPGIGEYIRLFGLTKERAKLLKPDCLIMHPGPINRGVEIDSDVADGVQSVILDQVTNGLAVRMAVLYLCGGISTQ